MLSAWVWSSVAATALSFTASFSAASLQAPPQMTIERLAKVPQP